MSHSSRIFGAYRALGFVSNHIPLVLRYLQKSKRNFVVTVIGKAFNVYDCSKLRLVSSSSAHEKDIIAMTADSHYIYTAAGNVIYAWMRGTEIKHTYVGHEKDVHLLLPFGTYLISVDTDNLLKVWNSITEELFLELSFDTDSFYITCMLHPSTYLNKVLLGSKQGGLQLWNLKTSKLLFTFPGWNSSVCVLEQAPAIDVVAIGLENGDIIIHNLKYDKTLMKFHQEWGPVTGLSFRTDSPPILASGSTVGHIALWNLEEKQLQTQILNAHSGSVTGMKFFFQEPILVTSSVDNSLKMWIFDLSDGGGRLLRYREGHHSPPVKIRFYDAEGSILSSGLDSCLKSFSAIVDNLNKNLGQASFNRKLAKRKGVLNDPGKMPPIIDFALERTREKEWDNIAACHRGLDVVTTWSYDRCKMGEHKLVHERFQGMKNVRALCVTITACGNFVLIGYSTGHVDRYNIQSGIFRGSYGEEKAHNSSIRGVVTDALNQMVVTGGSDKCIKFWKFKDGKLISDIVLDSGVAQFELHRESSMLAASLDNFSVAVFDLETRRKVRTFPSHKSRVTDMAFSLDARWLIVATMDCTIWIWDLPSGRAVDCFLVSNVCTSLTMSPSGDFLATAHADDLGIYLWSNKALYSHVSLKPLPQDYQPQLVDLPRVRAEDQDDATITNDEAMEVDAVEEDVGKYKSPEQIHDELVTLSLMPNSHWQNLLHLDIIRQRNKPKEPVVTPKAAPFFLPTVAGLQPKFAIDTEEQEKSTAQSKILDKLQTLSPFGQLVLDCGKTEDYMGIFNKLKEMGPSKLDFEMRSLSPEYGGSVELMAIFMKMVLFVLRTNQNYELVQSYLALFLQVHGGFISENELLCDLAKEISEAVMIPQKRIQMKVNQTLCLVNYLRSAVI